MLVREKFEPRTDFSADVQLHKRALTRTQMDRRGLSPKRFRDVCRDGVNALLDPEIISCLTAVVGKGFDDYNYNRYVSNRHAFDPLVDTNQLSVVYLAMQAFQQPFESSADAIKHVRGDLDKPSWNALQALPVQWLQRRISGALNELGTIYEICTGLGRQHRTETRTHVLGTLLSVHRYKYRMLGTPAARKEWTYTLGKLVVEEFDTEAPMAPARIVEDALGIVDYLYRNPDHTPDVVRRWTWRSLQNRSERWHIGLRYSGAHDIPNAEWTSALGLVDNDELELWATPLVSSKQLHIEGAEMEHCVRLYASRCTAGQSRIFSIRGHSRTNTATLELCPSERDGLWYISQNKGRKNRPPSAAARRMGEYVLARWNEITQQQEAPV